ncbi:tripartite tricarboxylate transporter substrate binding protein [Variovorax gossypii]|uniref:Tripartite tricarboxylate transporter substrate binding protein n=1 Tax=Variovorax gossypii TaxID=1679495 RepID=A0A431TPB5_9BURK|nr:MULTISPECIES: tripartite tricarboxylate transporter substrate binding protein [Variovorax]MDR6522134.1 tripartite-type tricarboxylate transporter receptor subunit TctC [Variovorax paradoxus]RTQ35566.1 tripartite tricarboxylate transporter substrate binding protein [Variovorax gossypii]
MHKPSARPRRAALRILGAALATTFISFAPQVASAQAYPDKPVKIVVGFAPGGTNDILARLLAAKLQEKLKQTFIVENKSGANSAIGNDFVAKAQPDGYTLLVSSSGGLTTNPILMKNLPYDPLKDFEPIALLGTFPLVVTVPASLSVKNFAELVQFSKTTKDGKLDNGTPTTSFVLVAETISSTAGVKFNHILYKGSGLVVTGLLGGEIQSGVLDSPAVIQQVKGGKLKALAVTTAKRSAALPDVPTIAELGYPGYDAPIWTALMAPKGTSAQVLAKLRAAAGEILKDKDMVEKMHALGMDPGDSDAAALSKRIASDIARWTKVAKAANLQPE